VSMTYKEILTKANEAISRGDFEGFLIHCTDDTEWNFLGDRTLRGKQAVRQWMVQTYKEPPRFKVRQMIAEGEFVAALGEITLKAEDGKATEYAYCDVWRFENGRMAELKAFVLPAD
jgi:ketosteroid isomerase-like protein